MKKIIAPVLFTFTFLIYSRASCLYYPPHLLTQILHVSLASHLPHLILIFDLPHQTASSLRVEIIYNYIFVLPTPIILGCNVFSFPIHGVEGL